MALFLRYGERKYYEYEKEYHIVCIVVFICHVMYYQSPGRIRLHC